MFAFKVELDIIELKKNNLKQESLVDSGCFVIGVERKSLRGELVC